MEKLDRLKYADFGNLELLAKQVVEGFITGLHKSPFHGFSVEFAEHRLYNSGESTRHIDWKLYARTERLYTKKYEEETNLRCQIIIDMSSSMYHVNKNGESKINYAVYATASLIELLKRQRDAVGISLFTNELEFHSEAKSSIAHHNYLYANLENHLKKYQKENKKPTFSIEALNTIAELIKKRSLVMIFTDLLESEEQNEDFFKALQHLKHNKHEVILFHVIDKEQEELFDLENRPYQLIDMETGEKIKLNPSNIKEQYQNFIKQHFETIKKKCLSYKIDFETFDINQPLQQVLLAYLIKRNKIK